MIDFAALNRELIAEARDLLPEWLPGGRFVGREYVCADVTGGKGHSFGVNVHTGRWTDRATGEKGGDFISLYAAQHGLSQGAAARALMGLVGVVSAPPPPRPIERRDESDDEVRSAAARRLWIATRPAPGTLVEIYFRTRGITVPPPPSIRFHPALKHASGHVGPAVVCGVQNVTGKFVAIQRLWLNSDGTKAAVDPQKMSLGPTSGGAVRLAEATSELAVCEGVETGLSYQQVTRRPTWACLGAPGLRLVEIPDCVRTLYIAADADEAGDLAAGSAANRFLRRKDLAVRIARPPIGNDFNEALLQWASA